LRRFLANIRPIVSLVILLAAGLPLSLSLPAEASANPPGYWVTVEKVVDGDTFWGDGVKYRLKEIDTPETSSDPRHGYKCEAERRLGELATAEAEAILLGRKVWIKPSGVIDRYKRPLVRVRYMRGKWYGPHMIKQRLAAPWLGRKHKWCETFISK